jgi:hypothetical protein
MTAERQAEFLAEHGKNFSKFKENPPAAQSLQL